MQMMNPAAYTGTGTSLAGFMDPNAWTGMMAPQAPAQAPAQQEAPAQQ